MDIKVRHKKTPASAKMRASMILLNFNYDVLELDQSNHIARLPQLT